MNKRCIFLLIVLFLIPLPITAQSLKAERALHQNILKNIKDDIKENYYDPKFRGIDIEEIFKQAGDLIKDAKSAQEMTDIVARILLPFDDSHLYFLPPVKTVEVDYGWKIQVINDKVFVTEINEKSDAYKKGVRVGDRVYMIEGFIPTRKEFLILRRHFEVLRPQKSLNIILTKPSGNSYKLDIKAEIKDNSVFMPSTRDLDLEADRQYEENTRLYHYDKIPRLSILKMTSFVLTPIRIEKMMDKIDKSEALILDLRGNGGGLLFSLEKIIGNFFDKEVTLGKVIERKGTSMSVIKPNAKNNYKGKLVVLVDSGSASASEIFARVVQIEKRGTVIGDQSAGAVMQSVTFFHTHGLDSLIPYGISVTVADLVMKDGQRLEGSGVTPDEKLFPTPQDLADKRDPVLSRAAEILGFQLSPEAAGKVFEKD